MRICIVKTSSLGDIVQTFPVVNYLKTRYPDVELDWIVEAPYLELVASHPMISRTLPVNTRAWRRHPLSKQTWSAVTALRSYIQTYAYDVVFDLQGNLKSGLCTFLTRSPHKVGYSWRTAPEWVNPIFTNTRITPPIGRNIREDYLALVQTYFKDSQIFVDPGVRLSISSIEQGDIKTLLATSELQRSPRVLVSAGSAWLNKQVPVETFTLFLKQIENSLQCSYLFAWGSEEEKRQAMTLKRTFPSNSIVLEKLSLAVLQNLMGQLDLVIAMDSLPLHLAGSTATPTFGLFGPSASQTYNPIGPHHGAFQGSCPYGRSFVKRCPILRSCLTGACLRHETADTLFASFDRWWRAQSLIIEKKSLTR